MPFNLRFIPVFVLMANICACNNNINPETDQLETSMENSNSAESPGSGNRQQSPQFAEGKDYFLFNRVKIMDLQAFSEPAEAYSILLPKDWQSEGGVIWTAPGQTCAGTNMNFSAKSRNGEFNFQILPNIIWSYSTDPQVNQLQQSSQYCGKGQPIDARQYIDQVWLPELGNATLIEAKNNPDVVKAHSETDDKARAELMRYGAAQVNYRHTALTAKANIGNGKAVILICGVTNAEVYIPNVYNGTMGISYTSSASRMLFTYPENKSEEAEQIASMIIGSIRTNPDWKDATNNYWRAVREQKQIEHLGKIRLMDERTRQIGEQTIAAGNRRLADMDNQLRSWEAKQSSQDRMHTSFIKTIREVEHYRDENGTVELSSGYNHAWSRGDGSSFLLSNSPNFDPSSVLQDQRWKEMRKIE
jgi:hypothetical protein